MGIGVKDPYGYESYVKLHKDDLGVKGIIKSSMKFWMDGDLICFYPEAANEWLRDNYPGVEIKNENSLEEFWDFIKA